MTNRRVGRSEVHPFGRTPGFRRRRRDWGRGRCPGRRAAAPNGRESVRSRAPDGRTGGAPNAAHARPHHRRGTASRARRGFGDAPFPASPAVRPELRPGNEWVTEGCRTMLSAAGPRHATIRPVCRHFGVTHGAASNRPDCHGKEAVAQFESGRGLQKPRHSAVLLFRSGSSDHFPTETKERRSRSSQSGCWPAAPTPGRNRS